MHALELGQASTASPDHAAPAEAVAFLGGLRAAAVTPCMGCEQEGLVAAE